MLLRLDFINNIVNNAKNNKFFLEELQNSIKKNKYFNSEKEDIPLTNPTYNENRIITKYRDKMLIERANILNNYAKQTLNKGEMYYIYSKNSKIIDDYNLCICREEMSHAIIEINKANLPNEAKIGSVLRKFGNSYILDEEATKEVEEKICNMKAELLKEQTEYLKSKRMEGHIYEMSENNGDRAWLFDITSGRNEGVEEIDFDIDLLKTSKEGDLFIYKNGKYQKYQ